MTEEEQELHMEIMSKKHKRLLMEIKSSEKWVAMSSDARAVYSVIVIFSDFDGSAFLSIKMLETHSGISRDAVIKALKELQEIRLIWDPLRSRGIGGNRFLVCCLSQLGSV